MATELPRPGVEVVQEFQTASPTVVTPTLVPCSVAPFFEVIEALASDGTVNEDAKLSALYEQLEQTVLQSGFPSPRDNIDEVDVLEDSIRTFFKVNVLGFGGALQELSRESAHLKSYLDPAVATQPWVVGSVAEGAGFDLDGRRLTVFFDSHTALPPSAASLPVADNQDVDFAASTPGGLLSIAEVVSQINAKVPGVASVSDAAGDPWEVGDKYLKLTSEKYGAGASVVVRYQGSANGALGFSSTLGDDTFAVGSGFYSIDDSDGDLVSPRLKVYAGNVQGGLISGIGIAVITAPNFNDDHVEVGDDLVADGQSIGQVALVESDQLTMEIEQNIISHDYPFAPRRVRAQANNLTYPQTASEAGKISATEAVAPATPAWIVAPFAFVGPITASQSIDVNLIKDGVALPTQTVSSGAGWTTLQHAVGGGIAPYNAGINDVAGLDFEAYEANAAGNEVPAGTGTHLGLRTKADNTSSGAGITVISTTIPQDGANAWDLVGFDYPFVALGDIGENQRYLPGSWARLTSVQWTGLAGARVIGEDIQITTNLGIDLVGWGAAHANDATGLANAILDWNGKALWTAAYESNVSGVESAGGGYFSLRTRGENFGVSATIQKTGGTDDGAATGDPIITDVAAHAGAPTDLDGLTFEWSLDLNPKIHVVTFIADEDDGGTSLQQVLDKINEETPGIAAASDDSPPVLELESNKVGESSEVEIGTGTANTILGFTDSAKSTNQDGRPDPDMAIDVNGNLVIQSQILRDNLTGIPYNPGFSPTIVAYRGLRLDLSPDADNPALLTVDDITTLQEAADPISTDNPGALMVYMSLLNAPTVSVAAIGVPEVSDDAPDGTPIGYAKCAEFLENEEVYAIATASQLNSVHQTFMAHVNAMSEPEQKGERVYFFNPPIPDRDNPDVVGSGTDANTTATPNEVTVEVNIAPALIEAGMDPNGDINPVSGPIENEVYVDIGSDDNVYLVQKVDNGTILTLRTAFESGDGNDDSFYSSDSFPATVISDDWSVFIRGERLIVPGTDKPDRNAISETIQAAAQAYGFRRGFYVHPDQVVINLTGLEQVVKGYYGTACITGMVGQLPPQQGFTNYPMTGLTRVVGSNDQFTQRQLNVMAAGGVYILVQDAQGAPIVCRHQLSTDLTSIETRELSITKVVDYTAKFMRSGLRNFIGRSNITQGFLDNLSTIVQGQLSFLVENTVLIGADVNNLIQDADAPDTVLVDVTLDVPFPCNYIRLTLII